MVTSLTRWSLPSVHANFDTESVTKSARFGDTMMTAPEALIVDETKELTPGETAYIQAQGKSAFHAGTPLMDNPYARHSHAAGQWEQGWKNEWWATADWRPKHGT